MLILDKLVIALVVGTGQGVAEAVFHGEERKKEKEKAQTERKSRNLFARTYHIVQTDRAELDKEGD